MISQCSLIGETPFSFVPPSNFSLVSVLDVETRTQSGSAKKGLTTQSRMTVANLDCAFAENAVVFVVMNIRGARAPPWPPLSAPSGRHKKDARGKMFSITLEPLTKHVHRAVTMQFSTLDRSKQFYFTLHQIWSASLQMV